MNDPQPDLTPESVVSRVIRNLGSSARASARAVATLAHIALAVVLRVIVRSGLRTRIAAVGVVALLLLGTWLALSTRSLAADAQDSIDNLAQQAEALSLASMLEPGIYALLAADSADAARALDAVRDRLGTFRVIEIIPFVGSRLRAVRRTVEVGSDVAFAAGVVLETYGVALETRAGQPSPSEQQVADRRAALQEAILALDRAERALSGSLVVSDEERVQLASVVVVLRSLALVAADAPASVTRGFDMVQTMATLQDLLGSPVDVVVAPELARGLVASLKADAEFVAAELANFGPEHGDTILDVPILGTTDDLERIMASKQIDLAIIAIPSASPDQRSAIADKCLAVGLPFKVLPFISVAAGDESVLGRVRFANPADLMVRPPAVLDDRLIGTVIKGRRVLVTGAAGSVGSELVRQLVNAGPESIICVDRAENPLLLLEKSVVAETPHAPLVTCVADVADPAQLGPLLKQYNPTIVFHAAAFKHVAFMEQAPANALRNNVGGTLAVARCSIAHGVERFVLVSTDKAVKPTSVMGATKRIAELIVRSMDSADTTRFTIVRFGNVLGSNASVVPIFAEQIERGGPLTVTDPEVTRYFMSIPEAAGLILQATAMSKGGDIFQLDMGDPIKIVDLAEAMIKLSGFRPYEDMDIVFTGLSEGEKLHEELAEAYESFEATSHPKLFVSPATNPAAEFVAQAETLLSGLDGTDTREQVKDRIRDLLPEYSPARSPA